MVPLPVLTKQKIMCWSMYYSRSIESKMIAIADCVRMLNGNHWIENTCMRLPQFGQPSHYRAAGLRGRYLIVLRFSLVRQVRDTLSVPECPTFLVKISHDELVGCMYMYSLYVHVQAVLVLCTM